MNIKLKRTRHVSRHNTRGTPAHLLFDILAPSVFKLNLLFLLGCEVVFNVKLLANLLGFLALDFPRDGLARHVEEALDVKVVGSLDDIKEGALVEAIGELDVP